MQVLVVQFLAVPVYLWCLRYTFLFSRAFPVLSCGQNRALRAFRGARVQRGDRIVGVNGAGIGGSVRELATLIQAPAQTTGMGARKLRLSCWKSGLRYKCGTSGWGSTSMSERDPW